jgi:hypothetical protein
MLLNPRDEKQEFSEDVLLRNQNAKEESVCRKTE